MAQTRNLSLGFHVFPTQAHLNTLQSASVPSCITDAIFFLFSCELCLARSNFIHSCKNVECLLKLDPALSPGAMLFWWLSFCLLWSPMSLVPKYCIDIFGYSCSVVLSAAFPPLPRQWECPPKAWLLALLSLYYFHFVCGSCFLPLAVPSLMLFVSAIHCCVTK